MHTQTNKIEIIEKKRGFTEYIPPITYGDVVIESGGRVNENKFPISTKWTQSSVMELGVLPNPGVTIIQVSRMDVFIGNLG